MCISFYLKIRITTSKFTQEEVDQLRNIGGNSRVSDIWLGSHSVSALEYEMMNRDLGYLKQHLTEKYLRKKWYDAVAASKSTATAPASLTRSSSSGRASSGSGADASELFGITSTSPSLTIAAPSAQGRTRTRSRSGSGTNLASGSSDHKAFLAETYARATGADVKSVASGVAGMGLKDESESDSDESSDDGKSYSLDMKEEKQRKKLKSKMTEFYKKYNAEKLKEVDIFVEWTLYHGLDAFNAKLIERYGVGIKMKKKASKLKERSRTPSQDKPGTLSPKVGLSKSSNPSPSLGVKSSPLVQQKKNPEQTLDIFSMGTTATTTTAPVAIPPPAAAPAPAFDIFGTTAPPAPQPLNPFAQQQDPFQALFMSQQASAPPPASGIYQQQQQAYTPPLYPTSQNYPFGTTPMQQYPATTISTQQQQQAIPVASKNPFDDMQLMF